jgi:MYXO-CTERM domain-containing protein
MDKLVLNGLAGAAALTAGSLAYGAIVVVSAPASVAADGNADFADGSSWDVDGDSVVDFRFNHRGTPLSPTYEWQANVFIEQAGALVSGYPGFFVTYYGSRLSAGDSIAGSGLVGGFAGDQVALGSNYYGIAYGGWGSSPSTQTTGYLGFQLSSGNYGWIEVTAGPTGITFGLAAYEDSGADILAGQIPTPGALSALALGAAGLLRRKR